VRAPLTKAQARALLTKIIEQGGIIEYSSHALEEMANDGLSAQEVRKALAGGKVGRAYQREANWRHTVVAVRCSVVITFRAETHTLVVTAWRNKR
jgi:Domain of unknown function (DUF4258)